MKEVFLDFVGDMDVEVSPTIGTDEVYHYRSKITPHYDVPKRLGGKSYEIGPIGFKEQQNTGLVDVPVCPIATEAINEKLAEVRTIRRREAIEGRLLKTKGATLLLRDAHDEGVVTDHNAVVTTQVAGLSFKFLAGNFFQNNAYIHNDMVRLVREAATRVSCHGSAMTHLIDCYCGSGIFCLSTADSFDVCVGTPLPHLFASSVCVHFLQFFASLFFVDFPPGIEVNDRAVMEAAENAKLNGITNCCFVSASAEAIFGDVKAIGRTDKDVKPTFIRDFPRDKTTVVLDPPRKGCSEIFLQQLYVALHSRTSLQT